MKSMHGMDAQRGGLRLRLIIIFLLGGFVLGPILLTKWYEGDLPFSPGRRAKIAAANRAITRWVDVSREVYTFSWAGYDGDFAAPTLAMRVEPTDFEGWENYINWDNSGTARRNGDKSGMLSEKGDGPADWLVLDIALPSADAPPLNGSNALCPAGETPFSACKVIHARLVLHRDVGWSDAFDRKSVLLGRKSLNPRAALPYPRITDDLREFWTMIENETDYEAIKGWACPAETPADRRTDAPGLSCFSPPHWWERLAPEWFGYRKHKVLFQCSGAPACTVVFLFHQRVVEIRHAVLPQFEQKSLSEQLFVAGWSVLNRQHAGALKAPDVKARATEESHAQVLACRAVAQEARRWSADGKHLESKANEGWREHMLTCLRAARLAQRMAETSPEEAIPLLRDALDGIDAGDSWSSMREPLHRSLFAALEATGQTDSLAMYQAFSAYLSRAPGLGTTDPRLPQREEDLRYAWSLAKKFKDSLSADEFTGHWQRLARHYRFLNKQTALVELLEGVVDELARQHGAQSPQLLEPLHQLGYVHWRNQNFPTMKQTADRLLEVWLMQPPSERPPEDRATLNYKEEWLGLSLVLFYRNFAFNQQQFAAVEAPIAEVVARMEREFGREYRFVRAVRFHQDEVLTRTGQTGPIGGGYLSTLGTAPPLLY